jgi:hypothetical protein
LATSASASAFATIFQAEEKEPSAVNPIAPHHEFPDATGSSGGKVGASLGGI